MKVELKELTAVGETYRIKLEAGAVKIPRGVEANRAIVPTDKDIIITG